MGKIKLTTWIIIAMVLGVAIGLLNHHFLPSAEVGQKVADYVSLVSDIFLRLIKMIIAPLVFSTLVVGIAKMGDTKAVGRVGLKSMVWFMTASLVSLILGMIMVNFFQPGARLDPSILDSVANSGAALKQVDLSLKDFITHLVPKSFAESMANNEILQIVVFSVFFGVACAALGKKAYALVHVIEEMSYVILKITSYVMNLAPIAVFAAIVAIVTKQGLGPLVSLGIFMVEFYLSLGLLWLIMIFVGFLLVGKRIHLLLQLIRQPLLLAFGTASSEAAYPKVMENLERFGVKKKITSFVLPLGYSFNLDGSMMYCTFATLFIAQVAGIDLSIGTQITMLLLLMVTSKGMAGVPRASLVVIAATLHTFNLPEAGIFLIMAIDQFLDMGRSATNVIGNSLAAVAVAKWEDELTDPKDFDINSEEEKSLVS